MNLVGKWQSYGISGWKEDYYDYARYDLRDDKVDPVNDRLMSQKQLVIERNGYLSSNGDFATDQRLQLQRGSGARAGQRACPGLIGISVHLSGHRWRNLRSPPSVRRRWRRTCNAMPCGRLCTAAWGVGEPP